MTETINPADVLDVGDIANLAGVPYETAMTWRRRSSRAARDSAPSATRWLPDPAGYVSGRPWWHRADVLEWLRATGRGPVGLR